jgi:hypothetical protein
MIHLYTKHPLNPSNHYWENERKLIFNKFSKSRGNDFSNYNWAAPIFELDLNLFMIHLYTKYHLNPSDHQWKNKRKLIFKKFSKSKGNSNLACISSWYICIPNIIWIRLTITGKMNGNCHYQEYDGWTDREPDGHRHTIIRPVFNRRITKTTLNKKRQSIEFDYRWEVARNTKRKNRNSTTNLVWKEDTKIWWRG